MVKHWLTLNLEKISTIHASEHKFLAKVILTFLPDFINSANTIDQKIFCCNKSGALLGLKFLAAFTI
jgi:hypothetical protein